MARKPKQPDRTYLSGRGDSGNDGPSALDPVYVGKPEGTKFLPANSSLALTEDVLTDIAEMALRRLEAIDTSRQAWLHERDIYENEYMDDFSHRSGKIKLPNGKTEKSIFEKSNISYNTTRRQIVPIVAKMTKDYIGSDPIFELRPRFTDNPEFPLTPIPEAVRDEDQNGQPDPSIPPSSTPITPFSDIPPQVDPATSMPPLPGAPATTDIGQAPVPPAMPSTTPASAPTAPLPSPVPPPPGVPAPAQSPTPTSGMPPPPQAGPPMPPPPVKVPTLTERINSMAQYKLGMSNLKDGIGAALERATVVGEQVLKCAHREQANIYQRYAEVLVSAPGVQISTKDGDPVYQTDAWRPLSGAADPSMDAFLQAHSKDHNIRRFQMVPGEPGTMAKKIPDPTRYGEFLWVDTQEPLVYEDMLAKGRKIIYRGPDFAPISRRDFYCSLDARTIHEAECIAHVFDINVIDLLNYLIGDLTRDDLRRPGQRDWFDRNLEILETMKGNTSNRKSDVGQPKMLFGEQREGGCDEYNLKALLAEVYMTVDADGDGKPEEIMVIIDKQQRKALWWDYTVNCTPRGVRPFEVIRIYPAPDRWYGISESKRQACNQYLIDFCVNRLMYQANLNGTITAYDNSVVPAWATEEPVPGKSYKMAKDKSPDSVKNAVMKWEVSDMPEGLNDLKNELMQISQMTSGNMNPGEQNNASLPAASLATGIRAIARAGQILDALRDINCAPCVTAIVFLGVRVMLRHMQPEEEFEYTNGDRILSDSISREEVEGLDVDVKLSLGVGRAEDQIQVLELARQIAIEFYGLPPDVQQMIRPLYIHAFKSMDIPEADTIFQPRQVPAGAQIGPDGNIQPVPPPKELASIKPPPNDPTRDVSSAAAPNGI